jgi:hypothetical protein
VSAECWRDEHQLNDSDVNAVGEQPARTFVSEIVPPQVDALQFAAGSSGCAATDPIVDVAWMEASASDAESLRNEQATQVRVANRLFMAADELRDFECDHQAVGQPAVGGRPVVGPRSVDDRMFRVGMRAPGHNVGAPLRK